MSGAKPKAAKAADGAKPKAAKKAAAPAAKVKAEDPLHPKAPKNLRVGGAVRPEGRDLSRFVKWPRYVRVQRQKKVLYDRLKVPPAINQFRKPLDKAEALPIFKLLAKYTPEDKAAKRARLAAAAAAKAAGKDEPKTPKPIHIKFGLNHVTELVESKAAKLVVIASDVDPIELVVWLPALCRKMGVPYVIVNNKGRLGALVHQKKAAALALTAVKGEDNAALERIIDTAKAKFVDNVEARRKWGGGIMGLKTQAKLIKREKFLAAEAAKRANL